MSPPDLDVLIIGTGFAGTYLLHRLLGLNYRVRALDAGPSLGGIWNHNTYPGARVDIQVPSYQLDIPSLWDGDAGFKWTQRFPAREEIQAYFAFAERRLGGLGRHCEFGTWVEGVRWDEKEGIWVVRARDGRCWRARFVVCAVGYAAKAYVPEIEGLEGFKGVWAHTAAWPEGGIMTRGKRVGVVGTGASGVQVVQAVARECKSLVVFQRSPALATPMQQREFDPEFDGRTVEEKKEFFRNRFTQWDGNHGAPIMRPAKEDSPEERKKEFDRLYGEGGFSYWGSNYFDGMFDRESNDLIYEYWRDSVRKRIKDEAKAGILAPKTSPYPFGTKRVPLEQTYFEAYNYDHVDIIDIQKDPIQSITASGIQTKSGASCDLDVLIFATGFDAATGSLTQIDIRGKEGKSLREEWRTGAKTFLGMAMEGFPNLFALYGPQSPSGTCNGPVCAQLQGDWLVNLFEHMKTRGKKYVEAQHDATEEWSAHATSTLKGTLLEETNSYFFGDNIPGKPRQLVYYFGGVPAYKGKLDEVEKEKYKEFDLLP